MAQVNSLEFTNFIQLLFSDINALVLCYLFHMLTVLSQLHMISGYDYGSMNSKQEPFNLI